MDFPSLDPMSPNTFGGKNTLQYCNLYVSVIINAKLCAKIMIFLDPVHLRPNFRGERN